MTNKIQLNVPNMKCNGCVTTIENTLKDEATIKDLSIDLNSKKVSLETETDSEVILKLLADAGFPAVLNK